MISVAFASGSKIIFPVYNYDGCWKFTTTLNFIDNFSYSLPIDINQVGGFLIRPSNCRISNIGNNDIKVIYGGFNYIIQTNNEMNFNLEDITKVEIQGIENGIFNLSIMTKTQPATLYRR